MFKNKVSIVNNNYSIINCINDTNQIHALRVIALKRQINEIIEPLTKTNGMNGLDITDNIAKDLRLDLFNSDLSDNEIELLSTMIFMEIERVAIEFTKQKTLKDDHTVVEYLEKVKNNLFDEVKNIFNN